MIVAGFWRCAPQNDIFPSKRTEWWSRVCATPQGSPEVVHSYLHDGDDIHDGDGDHADDDDDDDDDDEDR